MVFSNIDPARDSYRLWRRFSMPNIHGPRDAVAVTASVSNDLHSAYTFLLDHIVILSWTLVVYFGVLVSIRRYEKHHPGSSIARELFAGKSSPYKILKIAYERAINRKYRHWLILLWVFVALTFFVLKYAIPIIYAKYIIIGNAAPVHPQSIYVPSLEDASAKDDPKRLLGYYALEIPSVLRAAGSVESINGTSDGNSSVSVDRPETLPPDPGTSDPKQRINYRYRVTGEQLGLQHYPDLTLNVEGSCFTDYSWYVGPSDDYIVSDVYHRYRNSSNAVWISTLNSPSPIALFYIGEITATGPSSNITWAAIISSVNRTSMYPSTDPWYFTTSNNDPDIPYRVKEARPVLSCWQNDVWSYKDAKSSVTQLNSTGLPGLELALPLQKILSHFLGVPKVPYIGLRLGGSALASASTSLGEIFNASSSSLHSDLERLVFASYISTVNTLAETTLFASDRGLRNEILVNGSVPEGVDGFVIYSKDVTTLSVKALIVIPVIAAALWILNILVIAWPVAEMKALVKKKKKEEEEEEAEEEAKKAAARAEDGNQERERPEEETDAEKGGEGPKMTAKAPLLAE